MNFIWNVNQPGNIVLEVMLLTIFYSICLFALMKTINRKIPIILTISCYVLSFISYLFCLQYIFIAISAFFAGLLIIVIFFNLGVFRQFLANPFKKSKVHDKGKFNIEKVYDKESVYNVVNTAVLSFAKSKTGAIITFEKNTVLTDIMKNGVYIEAPVSVELLQTIFYPGTRLHDGAVIIRHDKIIAASVFFTPTARIISGKYGSRHRAALGISEVSDAVTVVVSEETGRISIACNGELESVEPNNFLRTFSNYMDAVQNS